MMTGRPVKITLTREEVFYCHRGRHPVLDVGQDRRKKRRRDHGDGLSVVSGRRRIRQLRRGSTFYTGALQTVTYKVPRYKFRGVRVFTNKPPCGPKRGHGTPQPRFALEVQLDKIAEDLGSIRRRCAVKHLRSSQTPSRPIICASAAWVWAVH